jgi:hypothetical protein
MERGEGRKEKEYCPVARYMMLFQSGAGTV